VQRGVSAPGSFALRSCEQLGPGRSEPDVGPGLVQLQPPPLDREFQSRAIFRWRRVVAEQKGAVDLLDVNPAVLDRLTQRLVRVPAGGAQPWRDRCRGGLRRISSAQNHVFQFAENGAT